MVELGIIADKCVFKHDGQGVAALNASWSFIGQDRFVRIFTPGWNRHKLCVGLVADCILSHQALDYPGLQTLSVSFCPDLCQEYDFIIDFMYIF